MTAYPIPNPFSVFTDTTGPLTGAYVYIGVAGDDPETNPIPVYQDAALSVPFAQPLRTLGGYLVGTGTPANAYPSTTPYSIRVRRLQGTSPGTEVFYLPVVHDELAEFLATLNSPSTIGLIGYNAESTYPASSVGKHLQASLSITDAPFNAKCDGTTDDTAAFQAALTYCLANKIHRLNVPGICHLVSKINYDNPVDNSSGGIVIYGGTIKTAVTGPLFDTTLPYTTAPSSEMLFLQDMTFIHTNPAAAGWLLSEGLLRLWMRGCTGIGFKLNKGTVYIQDWDIDSSNRFTEWQGKFIDQAKSENLRFGPKMEAAPLGAGVKIAFMQAGILGGDGSLFEGSLGPIGEIGAFEGLEVNWKSSEGNASQDWKLATLQQSRGLFIHGMRAAPTNGADPTFYNIDLGLSEDVVSIGNWCAGRLYDDTQVAPGMLQSIGDKPVDPSLGTYQPTWITKSGRFSLILPNGTDDMTQGITAHAGGGGASAVQLIKPLNVLAVVATDGDSVKLPPAVAGTASTWCAVFNGGAALAAAFPSGTNTMTQNNGSVASSTIGKGRLAIFRCVQTGEWIRTDVLQMPAVADCVAATIPAVVTFINARLAEERAAGLRAT